MNAAPMRTGPEHSEASAPDRERDQILNSRPSARGRPQAPEREGARISAEGLQEQNHKLRAENAWLKGDDEAGAPGLPPFARLTKSERRLLAILMRRGEMAKSALFDALYADRFSADDVPEPKIIDVYIAKIRAKLRAAGRADIVIETIWGRGYRLTPDARAALAAMAATEPAVTSSNPL